MNAQTATTVEPACWEVRGYNPEQDATAMHYLLGVSYSRSRAGWRAKASRAGGAHANDLRRAQADMQRAFLSSHDPIWTWLLENADTQLVVDPEQPHIIWAWLITSPPNIIHAVGCKWTVTEPVDGYRLSSDIARELLGDRLQTCPNEAERVATDCECAAHQVLTLETPQMRTRGNEAIGIDRPRTWSMDPTWLLTRMVSR